MPQTLLIRLLKTQDYLSTWQAMQEFTTLRGADTHDELWLLEHHPVYTQGLAGKPEHVLNHGDIPVIQTDRGGQVTYHGRGQLVAYTLFDLQRLKIGTRTLVKNIENVIINLLADYQIQAQPRCDAPGVYVDSAKICSIGLRVKRNCSYHGLALNLDMDLEPFSRINPCGYQGMKMTQLCDFLPQVDSPKIQHKLVQHFQSVFGYNDLIWTTGLSQNG